MEEKKKEEDFRVGRARVPYITAQVLKILILVVVQSTVISSPLQLSSPFNSFYFIQTSPSLWRNVEALAPEGCLHKIFQFIRQTYTDVVVYNKVAYSKRQ